MRRLGLATDLILGTLTYELSDGRWIRFCACAIREHGLEALLRAEGLGDFIPTGRLDVMQRGDKVGTVPATFEPVAIKSTSWRYTPREGDFYFKDGVWVAAANLGPGDLEAVPGFIRNYPGEKR